MSTGRRKVGTMIRKVILAFLTMTALTVGVVAGPTPSPASATPRSEWGGTMVQARTTAPLRACASAACPAIGTISAGKWVVDVCRIAAPDGGLFDAIISPTTSATSTRVGFFPTGFLTTGRTGNQCLSGIPGERFVRPNKVFNLRSCPALSGCPLSGGIAPDGFLRRDLCNIRTTEWDVIFDERSGRIGFAGRPNLIPADPSFRGFTTDSCL
jgi:hypothetical protein